MVCGDGFRLGYFPLDRTVEPEHEAQGEDYDLCLIESGNSVSRVASPDVKKALLTSWDPSAGICGIIRTSGLQVLSETTDYLCKRS